MKAVFKSVMFASFATLGLGLAACDSPAENAMEDQAEAIDEAAEADADALEDQADAIEEAGEETKDSMEEAADDMDASPQ